MIRRFIALALSIVVLMTVSFPAHARVWTIVNGGSLTSWFTQGVNGSGLQNIYENGFGTSASWTPGTPTRVNGYNCSGIGGLTDLSCADDAGEGAVPEIWGAAAVYSGTIRDFSDPNPGGDITWTGQSGTAPVTGNELFTNFVTSGSYALEANVGVGGLTGTFGCWNNPAAVNAYDTDFCGNGSGGATITTAVGQTIANRSLSNGMIGFVDNINTFSVTLSDTTYNSCLAAMDGSCGPNTNNTYATWTFVAPCATSDGLCCGTSETDDCPPMVPIPPAIWLFGFALGLLGWMRRPKAA